MFITGVVSRVELDKESLYGLIKTAFHSDYVTTPFELLAFSQVLTLPESVFSNSAIVLPEKSLMFGIIRRISAKTLLVSDERNRRLVISGRLSICRRNSGERNFKNTFSSPRTISAEPMPGQCSLSYALRRPVLFIDCIKLNLYKFYSATGE